MNAKERDNFIHKRRKGIGGTDIAAIMGLNPWKGPMDVYLEKVGLIAPPDETEPMYWGKAIEGALHRRYERDTDIILAIPAPETLPWRHPDYEWYLYSPDAVYFPDDNPNLPIEGGVDFKETSRRQDYGEPGTNEVPDHVACQAHFYMGGTGAKWWDIAVRFLAPRQAFAIYRLNRDEEIIETLIQAGKEFWTEHILKQVPPPLDESEATRRLLNAKYPRDISDMLPAPEIASEWFKIIQVAKEAIAGIEKDKAIAEAHLKDIIGDAAGLVGPNWKVTWKLNKGREEIDWKGIVMALSPDNLSDLMKTYTTIKPGIRVFRTWAKED